MTKRKAFTSFRNKGFLITFENGVTVSVQFGPHHYCSNRSVLDDMAPRRVDMWESEDAELGIYNEDKWLTREFDPSSDDDIIGWCKADIIVKALNWAYSWKK